MRTLMGLTKFVNLFKNLFGSQARAAARFKLKRKGLESLEEWDAARAGAEVARGDVRKGRQMRDIPSGIMTASTLTAGDNLRRGCILAQCRLRFDQLTIRLLEQQRRLPRK